MTLKKEKPLTLYEVRATIKTYLENGTKMEDIDAAWFDKAIYKFPSEMIRFVEVLQRRKK